jgi:hypothetical protein
MFCFHGTGVLLFGERPPCVSAEVECVYVEKYLIRHVMKYIFSPVFPALRSKHGVGAEDVGVGGEETREDLFRMLFHGEHLL